MGLKERVKQGEWVKAVAEDGTLYCSVCIIQGDGHLSPAITFHMGSALCLVHIMN